MATIAAHALTRGEIVKIDGQLMQVKSVRRVRHNEGYVLVTFADDSSSVFPRNYEVDTTGWRFR